VRAEARIRVERVGDRDVVVDRSASAPLAVRVCGSRILLASTAAAPVGGDELGLHIEVGAGAAASVGSVAAMVVWPGPASESSVLRTTVVVGPGGQLDLTPEPTVSVRGSHHRSLTEVSLATGATCRIIEEFSLGRSDEKSGVLGSSLRVERCGHPLLHHDEWFGTAGSLTSVGVGGGRHVLTALEVGDRAGSPIAELDGAVAFGRLPLADDAVVTMVVGPDRPAVRAAFDRTLSRRR
jgi:urease accessory protein